MKSYALLFGLSLFAVRSGGPASDSRHPFSSPLIALPERAASSPTSPGQAAQGPQRKSLPDIHSSTEIAPDRYTLTPEKRAKAIAYSRARYSLHFGGIVLSVGIYFLLWRAGLGVLFRNWARRVSSRCFVQCLVFVPLLLSVVTLLKFPLAYYSGFVLERRFDLSRQTLASWLADEVKGFAITAVLVVLLAWVFYWVVDRSPRRWWFYFWMVSIPLVLAFILVEPSVIDPLYFKFTPLEDTEPALALRVETMLHRAGLIIPISRMFEMNASTKTKMINAYIAGIGPSKRVVVWDNSLRKLDEDATLLVLGHETGHYVLHHIPKEFTLIELVVLAFFGLGYIGLSSLVERSGPRTGIESVGDLASLPIALLVLAVLGFLSSPIINGISRYYEHQADQFALEVALGVVANPNAAEVRSLQTMGEEDLDDPDPNAFIKFWLYSHPPLDERIRFAAHYKPWAEGRPLELVQSGNQ